MNVVSSDRCQKNIARHCTSYSGDLNFRIVMSFHQESPTLVTFSFDYRQEGHPLAVEPCSARYYGRITALP